jgi:hypothetical protein
MKKAKRFTFKTNHPTGSYSAFFNSSHDVKLNKVVVGNILDDKPHKIRLMVIKADINEDGNPNCAWKWITLKHDSDSLQDAKDFLNANFDIITGKYNIVVK